MKTTITRIVENLQESIDRLLETMLVASVEEMVEMKKALSLLQKEQSLWQQRLVYMKVK